MSIYAIDNLCATIRDDLSIFQEGILESKFVELRLRDKPTIIGEVYRVPGTSEDLFLSYVLRTFEKIRSENKYVIMGTDQNIDLLKSDNKHVQN